ESSKLFSPFNDGKALGTFGTSKDHLPYATISYASVLAALQNYEGAAITMHNWLEGHGIADPAKSTVAQRWVLLRARFALANILEEWVRTRGEATSSWLRQYHIQNLE